MRPWPSPLVGLLIFLALLPPRSAFFVQRSPHRCFQLPIAWSSSTGDGPDEARTVLVLREELGLRSDTEVAALVEGYPGVATLEEAELRARLAVLVGGFRSGGGGGKSSGGTASSTAGKRAARSLVARHPGVLRHGAEEVAARLAALRALLPGLRSGELMQLLQRQPTLLGLDTEAVVAPNVAALRRLLCLREEGGGGQYGEPIAAAAAGGGGGGGGGGQQEKVARKDQAVLERVVRHAPSLLAYDSEVLAAKLGAIAELLNVTVARAAGVVSSKAPTLLTLSVDDNLRPSFRALAALLLPPSDGDDDGGGGEGGTEVVDASPGEGDLCCPLPTTAPLYLTPGYAATAKVLQRAPSLLAYSNATIKRKVQQLENVLFASSTVAATGAGAGAGAGAERAPAETPSTGEGADERRAAVAKLVALAPNVLTLDMEGNLLPKVRELQVLFARRQPSEEATGKARAVRQAAALRLLVSRPPPKKRGPPSGSSPSKAPLLLGRARAGKGKASSLLRASLSLRIAERTALGGSGGSGGGGGAAVEEAAEEGAEEGAEEAAPAVATGDDASKATSGGVGGSGVDGRGGLLAPLLPRVEVVRLVARAPTLLQRNVATSLTPKLDLLRRHVGAYGGSGDVYEERSSSSSSSSDGGGSSAGGGDAPSPRLASGADELVRCYPRLLLSSYGVLGRVVFLAQKQRSERRAARARLLQDIGRGDDDDDDDCLRSVGEGKGKDGGGLSGNAAKAAIMAPAAKFRAAHGDEYARYLRSVLLAHHRFGASAADGCVDPTPSVAPSANDDDDDDGGGGSGSDGEGRTMMKEADGDPVLAAAAKKRRDQIEALLATLDTCPVDKLETEHGEALKAELLAS